MDTAGWGFAEEDLYVLDQQDHLEEWQWTPQK